MFKRHKVGRYHVGVCTNTMCAVLGGDAIWSALSERLGIGHDEVTADGAVSLERIECQAACTHAPVMTANWEFLDDMDVARALEVVEKLRAGEEVFSSRGPRIGTYEEIERSLAGVDDDGLADAAAIDPKMLAGLTYAREHAMAAPPAPAQSPLVKKAEG
jgi:NADH-quinone oxidoreductase subunit E